MSELWPHNSSNRLEVDIKCPITMCIEVNSAEMENPSHGECTRRYPWEGKYMYSMPSSESGATCITVAGDIVLGGIYPTFFEGCFRRYTSRKQVTQHQDRVIELNHSAVVDIDDFQATGLRTIAEEVLKHVDGVCQIYAAVPVEVSTLEWCS